MLCVFSKFNTTEKRMGHWQDFGPKARLEKTKIEISFKMRRRKIQFLFIYSLSKYNFKMLSVSILGHVKIQNQKNVK